MQFGGSKLSFEVQDSGIAKDDGKRNCLANLCPLVFEARHRAHPTQPIARQGKGAQFLLWSGGQTKPKTLTCRPASVITCLKQREGRERCISGLYVNRIAPKFGSHYFDPTPCAASQVGFQGTRRGASVWEALGCTLPMCQCPHPHKLCKFFAKQLHLFLCANTVKHNLDFATWPQGALKQKLLAPGLAFCPQPCIEFLTQPSCTKQIGALFLT